MLGLGVVCHIRPCMKCRCRHGSEKSRQVNGILQASCTREARTGILGPPSRRQSRKPYGRRYTIPEPDTASSWTKCTLAFTSILMLIIWPATILLGLIDTVQHTVFEEPPNYRARKSSGGGTSDDVKLAALGEAATQTASGDRGLLTLCRLVQAGRTSTTMLVQVIFYFTMLHLLSFFGLAALFHTLKPDMEWLMGHLTGSLHRLRDGRTVPLSLPGSMDPTFDMPHSPCTAFPQTQRSNLVVSGSSSTGIPGSAGLAVAALPSGGAATSSPKSEQSNILSAPEHVRHCCPVCPSPQAARQAGSSSGASPSGAYIRQECVMARASAACCPVDSAADAHFMAMAAKLIYEDPRVIADCLEHRWGLQVHDMQHILGHAERECWLPDMVWCVCSNKAAVVLVMKGADPVYQLDLRADPPCIKSPRPGVGTVHDGLWAGLHQADPDSPAGCLVVDRILDCLQRAAGRGKAVYLCGHSLGGGLVSMLSLILPTRLPGFEARIGGIFTFGAPRIGDAESARISSALYHGRFFRYMHASDMVCSLPPAWGYEHQGLERFILSFPARPGQQGSGLRCGSRLVRQEADEALWRRARRREDHWAFAFGLIKLARAVRSEGLHRLALRAAMLPFPGFGDHFPCEYEIALRQELQLSLS
ncbi:hypothetical protein CVIRNUC_005640 [Coccomyxa viridis]|uniref:Fungal lipase-type domain-containing protein n=1 Tax=Coccomyxa viridis TaxID=1274662 RepID=A0AAV1I4Z9_9CHLO|nr:hypothetical protein CVIRNUC_005640 [Coccomyxa viridis]